MNENQINEYVNAYYEPSQNDIDENHPAYSASLKPNWKYLKVSILMIRSFAGSNAKEIDWFNNEVKMWTEEYGVDKPNRWLTLEKEYLANISEMPLILIQGTDGYYYIADGHHRHAIALKNDLVTIPSVVALVEEP